MRPAIYAINFIVLLSMVIDLRVQMPDRRLSLALVRIFFIIPSLMATYLSAYFNTEDYIYPYFYHTENIVALLWLSLASRFYRVIASKNGHAFPFWAIYIVGVVLAVILCVYEMFHLPTASLADGVVIVSFGSMAYCSALFLIAASLMLGWRLEAFWRSLDPVDKWRYKFLMVGLILGCAVLVWSCAYRMAYLRIPRDHFLLLAILLAVAWGGMGYAMAVHRLLNRKLFVSRKVVYASIIPMAFSVFFMFIGFASLMTRLFNWTVPFTLQWLVIALGVFAIAVLSFSGGVRRRIKYFISTHFYVNKYEYRDEWLAFSYLLQGKLTENGVVEALYRTLQDCLYTNKISIWLGDIRKGFHFIGSTNEYQSKAELIPGDDAIVCYLHNVPYLYSEEGDDDSLRHSILKEKETFLKAHDVVLMVPLILGSQCVGLIGLGHESTGGRYGHDDFDLLAALSSHAASALLAIKNAELLARTREQSVWNNLSAFVLHDIKNAATMLDLVRKNAGQHIDDPEFQKDMLESIDDALKRMGKVQTRLSTLQDELIANTRVIGVGEMLKSCVDGLSKNLPDLEISLECPSGLSMETDPDFIRLILENLLINSLEAGGKGTAVRIKAQGEIMVQIDLQDDGPGILPDLLPHPVFEPFRTSKPSGSGIGLWQVRQLVECLGGDVQARNSAKGGAIFSIMLPKRLDMEKGRYC